MSELFQGKSARITRIKERNLNGLVRMRVISMKSLLYSDIGSWWFCDVYCGAGEQTIDGEAIDGSPIELFNAAESLSQIPDFRHHVASRFRFYVSDLRPEAIASVETIAKDKFSHGADLLGHNSYASLLEAKVQPASEALAEIHDILIERPRDRAFIFLDPNGPKTFAYSEFVKLLADKRTRDRIDVIVNISATGLKRIRGSVVAAGPHPWIGRLETVFVDALGRDADEYGCWIREPINGDAWEWCMLAYWSHPKPRFTWTQGGFVPINSPQGRAAVMKYSHTAEERRNAAN
jgi:three-Cys-motif partner protein